MGRKKIKLLFILVFALILRLININQSFWLDEAAQMIESSRPFSLQFALSSDFHPPLYHLLLHFWIYFGKSETFARIPSVVMGVLSVYFIYKVARLLNIKRGLIPAVFLLSLSPYHIYFSQEVRPYMLFALLSLASVYYWLKKDGLKYIFVNILLLYTNYFASFVLSGQLIATALFDKKSIPRQIRSLLYSFLFFLPWAPKFLRQITVGLGGGFNGWTDIVSESAFRNIPLIFAKFVLGRVSIDNNIIYAFVLFPSFAVLLKSCLAIIKKNRGRLILGFFLFSLLLPVLVSVFFPVTAPQRLIYLLPVYILIISYAGDFLPYRIFILNISIVILTNCFGLFLYYSKPQFQREDWRQSVNWLQSAAGKNHAVIFAFPEPFAPFLWYNSYSLKAAGVAEGFKVDREMLIRINSLIDSSDELYYYSYLSQLTDPENRITGRLNSTLNLTEIKDFPGVGFVYVYKKNAVK